MHVLPSVVLSRNGDRNVFDFSSQNTHETRLRCRSVVMYITMGDGSHQLY